MNVTATILIRNPESRFWISDEAMEQVTQQVANRYVSDPQGKLVGRVISAYSDGDAVYADIWLNPGLELDTGYQVR